MDIPTQEKTIECVERGCDEKFTMTAGEQRFYVDKGLFLPKRCSKCRDKRRIENEKRMENAG